MNFIVVNVTIVSTTSSIKVVCNNSIQQTRSVHNNKDMVVQLLLIKQQEKKNFFGKNQTSICYDHVCIQANL